MWPSIAQCLARTHQLRSIPFPSDGFVRFQQLIINNISVFEGFWPSFTRTVVNIEITYFEATERSFTSSSISVIFLELSMHFNRLFLRMKEENHHFLQMTIIWHKIRHFLTTKSIWRQNKITNVSKRFVYHMSKLGSWRFGYVKIDKHLLLEPSIHKQRELSCALAHLILTNLHTRNYTCVYSRWLLTISEWRALSLILRRCHIYLIAVGYGRRIIFLLTYLDFSTLTRIQLRCFNLQNDAYIINQYTSHFYWNLNGCYCRICKWTRFPIRLGVNHLKMQFLITPLQCTLSPQKFNWVISGLMFTSDFNFINTWTVFPFTTVLPLPNRATHTFINASQWYDNITM